MNHFVIKLGELTALAAAFLLATCSAQAANWLDADIGSPAMPGSHTKVGSTLTVTGAGTGDHQYGGDQLHYTYLTLPTGGDIDVTARIADFAGAPHGRAGIMLRASNDPLTTTADVGFSCQEAADGNNDITVVAHDQALNNGQNTGMETRIKLPLWLRLVRIGNEYGGYKSADGHIWSSLGNTSGWQFAASGPIEVGFFVAGGKSASATATIDNIHIGPPAMGYTSSWYGNTAGGNVSDGHVSNGIGSLWTAPDGSCYTNSAYDEGNSEAVKLYKDGRVIKSFRQGNEMIGNSSCGEGSITSDGKNMFLLVAGYEGHVLAKTDMFGTVGSTVPMGLSFDPFDAKRGINIISGLAADADNVYISDSRANLIRVARKSIPIYYKAGNSSVNITTQPIDTTGVAHAAPAVVYQSQRECDYLPYLVPGLDPKTTYTLRCHFAEYKETAAGKRLVSIGVNGAAPVINYDVVAAAGGPFKPAVLDIKGARTDANGNLSITFNRGDGGDGHLVICGFEVLKPDGTQAFALDCGGPATGGFSSETYDMPDRSFSFERPGPMAIDSRGDLWIIREANDFPVGATISTKYPGAILCYHPDGTFTGKQITDVANPTALAYDPIKDRLLITDNGPNQNIRFYADIATKAAYAGSFGQVGGIYSKSADAGIGQQPRFYGVNGVGVDDTGNIYVSCAMQGTDLRKYTPTGSLVWMVNGLLFCNTPSIDPDSDGTQAYSVYWHGAIDYTKKAPGKQWSYVGYNWDPKLYGDPPRQGNAQAIMRRLGPSRSLFMFTSGQGSVEYCGIFRYNGGIVIPCGQIRHNGEQIWIDKNGDGIETPDEVTTAPSHGGLARFSVDKNGDVWMTLLGATPIVRHFRFKGLNEVGAPIYDFNSGDYEDIAFPGIGKPISTWGQSASAHYDVDSDTMYLTGPAVTRTSDRQNEDQYLARYDNWSKGNRQARWTIMLPDPSVDVNVQYEVGLPWGVAHQWMGMDVAGDKIFTASIWGNVNVYSTVDGSLDMVMSPGPEIEASDAWEDASMGLNAFQRKNGEIVVFTENSGFNGKAIMFLIPPSAAR